jgi:hypothetical protein
MGLFKSFKKMLAPIGGAVGFAIGGPMGAALGSGIGSLAGGGDVEDALIAGAVGFAGGSLAKGAGFGTGTGQGIERLLPSYTSKGVTTSALGFGPTSTNVVRNLGAGMPEGTALMPGEKKGIFSMFDDMGLGGKAALGLGAAGLIGALSPEEEEAAKPIDYGPDGKAFGKVVGRSGTAYDVNDPRQMESYRQELRQLQQPGYDYRTDPYAPVARSSGYASGGEVDAEDALKPNQYRLNNSPGSSIITRTPLQQQSYERQFKGEVDGPGTGTSDSVPARLSDGEFVLTAKAVEGAGGGDRDIGAARLYDMMSELEATA